MKLADIDPKVTPWSLVESDRRVGNWSFVDRWDEWHDRQYRHVYHYDTLMGTFARGHGCAEWYFVPVSTGECSVSDQAGMNKIMHGYGWWFRRAGHAAYVNVSGGPLRVV